MSLSRKGGRQTYRTIRRLRSALRAWKKVIRNASEIDAANRQAIEHLIGAHLADHQQVIISVVSVDLNPSEEPAAPQSGEVPSWWNFYEGLSDEDIDRLDQAVRQRANLTRPMG